jgi:hypothetical protein
MRVALPSAGHRAQLPRRDHEARRHHAEVRRADRQARRLRPAQRRGELDRRAAGRGDLHHGAVAAWRRCRAKDGSFPGAKALITMPGGESLTIETTALATLALIPSGYR